MPASPKAISNTQKALEEVEWSKRFCLEAKKNLDGSPMNQYVRTGWRRPTWQPGWPHLELQFTG